MRVISRAASKETFADSQMLGATAEGRRVIEELPM